MLKSKESRDTLLLAFMALIVIGFLLYLFLPLRNGKEKTNNDKNKTPPPKEMKRKPVKIKLPIETEPTEESILEEFNKKIEDQLDILCTGMLESETPFHNYDFQGLKTLLLGSKNSIVEKLYKYSFFDLNDIAGSKFPESYSDSLKFNLFLSLFLIKVKEEFIEEAFASLPQIQLEKLVDFAIYRLLDNEIEKNYQSLPLLFYFKHLIRQLNLYPAEDITRFFKKGIKSLRDLSTGKYLVKIQELLGFSQRKEKHRIEWIEEDGIFGDDEKTYRNLNLKIFNFLKQDYLVFPDAENSENNIWIQELCKSDSGDIELEFLNIQNEDPSRPLNIHKIVYTPISAQFIVLLNEYSPGMTDEWLNRIVVKRMADFHKNFTIIDFSWRDTNPKLFKQELKKFGNHLKKNIPKDKG
ncbi:MAG: hypothetical protein JSV88_04820 [Candidatus Aminicenantes bacterium]|nr:MAG: hypothetical protein JSV88_04820 [Candidatus Aminicenantes bacterium]